MSYTQKGSFLNYFVPRIAIAGTSTHPLSAINVAAANGTHGEFICVVPCTLRQLQATVILAVVADTTAPYLTLAKSTLPAGGGTVTTIDTVVIPGGAAVGNTYYQKDLSTSFLPGQALNVSWTIATGGSVAGQVVFGAVCDLDPETPANSSLMVASA